MLSGGISYDNSNTTGHALLESKLSSFLEHVGQSQLGQITTVSIVIKYPLTRYIKGIVTPHTFKG